MSPSTDNWTVRRLLDWTAGHFGKKGVDSPRLAAEMLLAHVLGVERLKLYMDPDRPCSELERAAYRDLVERAAAHEPVDYLVGLAPFFSMLLKVSPAVLIPRPSTETVVEHVIQHAKRTPGFRTPHIADVCTGSGAIAIALAKHLPGCRVTATDLHEDALVIAEQNAGEQGVADRITFRQGDLLQPLGEQRFHYVVSNPPYIPEDEWLDVAPNVKDYEPHHALRGGIDGLDLVRKVIAGAPRHLEHPGQLVVEIAAVQKRKAIELAGEAGLQDAHVLVDHEKLPRVLVANR